MLDVIEYYANLIRKEKDIHSLLDTIARFARDITKADRCSIWVLDNKSDELWTIIAQNAGYIHIPMTKGIVGYAIKTQQPIIVNDVYKNDLFYQKVDTETGYKTKCTMIIPITDTSGHQVGAIQALNKQDGNHYFTHEDLEYFKISASYIGNSLETLFLKQQLKDMNKQLENTIQTKTHELQELNKRLEIKINQEIQNGIQKDKTIISHTKQAQIGQMLSIIAHELKQPLARMYAKCSTAIVEMDLLAFSVHKNKKNYEEIREDSEFLKNTVDEFRDFFNPNKEQTTFYIKDMFNKVFFIVRKDFLTHNAKITTSISNVKITNYYHEIMHVLLNILNNSKDAINENNIKNGIIKISTKVVKDKIKIDIQDNGGGIKCDNINDIFKPYFTTKDEARGTGIGLYIAKMIIEGKCGGKIYAKNIKDGAKFTIELNL